MSSSNIVSPPKRVKRSYTQRLNASAKTVFPLLCPVKEIDWVPDWPLKKVYSNSGYAEQDCVFVTKDQDAESVWIITQHDTDRNYTEMVKINPALTVCRLSIQLEVSSQNSCLAHITYSHIALTPKGDQFVDNFTESYYKKFMQGWESQLNSYLDSIDS